VPLRLLKWWRVTAQVVASEEGAAESGPDESTAPEQDAVFAELLQAKAQGTPIEVVGLRRIRNGILRTKFCLSSKRNFWYTSTGFFPMIAGELL